MLSFISVSLWRVVSLWLRRHNGTAERQMVLSAVQSEASEPSRTMRGEKRERERERERGKGL